LAVPFEPHNQPPVCRTLLRSKGIARSRLVGIAHPLDGDLAIPSERIRGRVYKR
jgi:hypothetical protein